jgi:hypothetical protein
MEWLELVDSRFVGIKGRRGQDDTGATQIASTAHTILGEIEEGHADVGGPARPRYNHAQ